MPRRSRSSWRIDPRAVVDFFTVNWALKLTAFVLAFLLWSVVKAEQPTLIEIANVPVRVENRDAGWMLAGAPEPATVSLIVLGPSSELLRLAFDPPDILVPVDDVRDSTEVMQLRTTWVRMRGGSDNVRVQDVRPDAVELRFDRVETRLIPLSVTLSGSPARGFAVAGPAHFEPSVVRVSGPRRRLARIDTLRLTPIDLTRLAATDTTLVSVDTTGLGVLVSPPQVQVIIDIEPVGPDSLGRRAPARTGDPRGRPIGS
jgi:YbbR domain-containing protein